MSLTLEEIRLIFELIREKYGPGYTGADVVDRLQAKLSIMAEVKTRIAETAPQPQERE